MQNDLPKWNNFVQRMKERRGNEMGGRADKVAVWGAQRVREGNEEGGQGKPGNG